MTTPVKRPIYYLQYPNDFERKHATQWHLGRHSSKVLAIEKEDLGETLPFVNEYKDGTLYRYPLHFSHLREKCKIISEHQANQICPLLVAEIKKPTPINNNKN